MKLVELSVFYRESAAGLRGRIRELRALAKQTEDPDEVRRLRRRIAELETLAREMRELAQLTAHYYDRRFYRGEKYCF